MSKVETAVKYLKEKMTKMEADSKETKGMLKELLAKANEKPKVIVAKKAVKAKVETKPKSKKKKPKSKKKKPKTTTKPKKVA